MMCGITRTEKRKIGDVTGLSNEANRDANNPKELKCSVIDWNKTRDNIYLVQCDNWLKEIKQEISDAGIEKYRKDAIVMLDTIYTASPEFFKGKTNEEIKQYFVDVIY